MKVQIQSPGPGSCILNRRPFLSLSQSLGEGVVRAVNDPRILKRSRQQQRRVWKAQRWSRGLKET